MEITAVRGLTTALVVAGVALVGVLAAADALRGNGEDEGRGAGPGTTTTSAPRPSLQETLRSEVVIGVLLYSDEECRLHSLVLPRMIDQVVEGAGQRCRFDSTDGWILAEDEVLSPNWRFVASCSGGQIVVRDAQTGIVSRRIEGCTPAWRPRIGNRLTWVRDGAIYERGRPLLTTEDLRAAALHHPNLAFVRRDLRINVHVRGLAWLDTDHLAASLGIRAARSAPEFLLVLFEGGEVIAAATNFQTSPSRLFAAPTGSYVAGDDGTVVTAEGDVIDPPDSIPDPLSVSFSPDERWLAYATGNRVYLVATPRNNDPNRIITLPLPARDVAWERTTTSLTFPRASR